MVVGGIFAAKPGFNSLGMIVATAKLAINIWSKKHSVGKIIGITKPKNLIKNSNISVGINKAINYAKNAVNCFFNGVSITYLAGNMIELASEYIGNVFSNNTVADVATETYGAGISTEQFDSSLFNGDLAEVTKNTVPELVSDISNEGKNVLDAVTQLTDFTLEQGASYDLSGLTRGFVSSDATESVHLMSGMSDNLIFDRIVNGRAHFLQPNGENMGWYNLEDVKKCIADTLENVNALKH